MAGCHLRHIIVLLTTWITLQVVDGRAASQPCVTKGCFCTEPAVLDCSGNNLQSIDFRQANAEELKLFRILKLNNNDLQRIPELAMFSGIHTLDLSNNKLAEIPAGAFSSLEQLLALDVSFNNITLSARTVQAESFQGLKNLKTLRMKQHLRLEEFDYEAVAVLHETLEELYITGTPTFSMHLARLSHLRILSLGGSQCNIPSMMYEDQPALSNLPLERLSARNCKIRKIDREFLQSFKNTLERLDLSCNHLKDFLRQITTGVGSKIHTLILDNINREGFVCPWNDASNQDLEFLRNTSLKTLSLQANQLKATTNLNLRDTCSKLTYLDVSQNDFSGAAFYIASTVQGQPPPSPDQNLFGNKNLQPPALRFLGLQALTATIDCERYDERILNCNEDSPLFLDDDFFWDHNHQSDIMDVQLLHDVINAMHPYDLALITAGSYSIDNVVNIVTSIVDNMDVDYTSHQAINNTVYRLVQDAGGLRNVYQYLKNARYIFTNATTLALGYNTFITEYEQDSSSDICSTIYMYPNNLDTLNFSYSNFAFGACNQMTGFKYLTNISCTACGMYGWKLDTFQNFPLKKLEVSKNKLGQFFREDFLGERLQSAPLLERLYLGDQQDGGIQYFSNISIFSHHTHLTSLDLHRNRLVSWNITIAKNRKLIFLDLRDNEIPYIDEAFRNEINTQNQEKGLEIYLAGNDVQCKNISTLPYIYWLLNSTAVVDAKNIKCAESEMTISQYLDIQQGIPNEETKTPENLPLSTIFATCIVFLVVLGLLLVGWTQRYSIIFRWHQQRASGHSNEQAVEKNINTNIYASYTKKYLEEVISLQQSLQENGTGVDIITRDGNSTPGLMTQVSIARLIARSDSLLIFLTSDYLKDKTTRFEFELFKQKGINKATVITFGIESASQIEHLPTALTDIISNEKHIVWPKGICAGSLSGEKAVGQVLVERLRKERV